MEKEKQEGILLGLDASSTMIGVCLWDKDKNELIDLTYINPSSNDGVLGCGENFKLGLENLLKKYPTINEVAIEKAFIAMYGVSSSANTTALLNQVNAIYQWICKEKGLRVRTIEVSFARKLAFPKLKLLSKAKAGMSQKEQVFAYVMEELEVLSEKLFPTKVISRGKNAGNTVFEDHCLDMADSYVIAKSCMVLKELEKLKDQKQNK